MQIEFNGFEISGNSRTNRPLRYFSIHKGRIKADMLRCNPDFINMPGTQRVQLYGKAVDIQESTNPKVLFTRANEFAKEMLTLLEDEGYLSKDVIFKGCTAKGLLALFLEDTIKNSVESVESKWRDKEYIGAQIGVVSFLENDELWIRILDNGIGFKGSVLKKAGKESLASKDKVKKGKFKFPSAMKDHLFKMGQTASLLGWQLVVENRENSPGASVSVVIPFKK